MELWNGLTSLNIAAIFDKDIQSAAGKVKYLTQLSAENGGEKKAIFDLFF